jgi:hypothetical protein
VALVDKARDGGVLERQQSVAPVPCQYPSLGQAVQDMQGGGAPVGEGGEVDLPGGGVLEGGPVASRLPIRRRPAVGDAY